MPDFNDAADPAADGAVLLRLVADHLEQEPAILLAAGAAGHLAVYVHADRWPAMVVGSRDQWQEPEYQYAADVVSRHPLTGLCRLSESDLHKIRSQGRAEVSTLVQRTTGLRWHLPEPREIDATVLVVQISECRAYQQRIDGLLSALEPAAAPESQEQAQAITANDLPDPELSSQAEAPPLGARPGESVRKARARLERQAALLGAVAALYGMKLDSGRRGSDKTFCFENGRLNALALAVHVLDEAKKLPPSEARPLPFGTRTARGVLSAAGIVPGMQDPFERLVAVLEADLEEGERAFLNAISAAPGTDE